MSKSTGSNYQINSTFAPIRLQVNNCEFVCTTSSLGPKVWAQLWLSSDIYSPCPCPDSYICEWKQQEEKQRCFKGGVRCGEWKWERFQGMLGKTGHQLMHINTRCMMRLQEHTRQKRNNIQRSLYIVCEILLRWNFLTTSSMFSLQPASQLFLLSTQNIAIAFLKTFSVHLQSSWIYLTSPPFERFHE